MVRTFCVLLLKMTGWKFVNNVPDDIRSFVALGVPHTSNFDFFPGVAASKLMKRNARFVIKSEWMKFPFSLIMKPAGALGLDREKLKGGSKNTTDAMADLFKEHKELVLLIAPEGTRSPRKEWKTGFYFIAQKAGVPIVLGFADYEKKEYGLGKVIYPTDFEKDMGEIMDFYRNIKGKKPENFLLDERFS